MASLNGIITNNKFCLSRTGRLQLSWWRLPLRTRKQIADGVESPPKESQPVEESDEKTAMESSA